MGNSKSVNPLISYSSKPDYFDGYKFENVDFEIYEGVEPIVSPKYPVGIYDGMIEDKEKNIIDVQIFTIFLGKDNCLTTEIVYMFKSKQDGKLLKPIYKKGSDFSNWIELIYSWVTPDILTMKPVNNDFTDFYLTRKVYLEQEPDTPHLAYWAGKKHYIEFVGGPEPVPACACCGETRIPKPSEEEYINSTETIFKIKQPDYTIDFNSNSITISLTNGEQIKNKITYRINNSIVFDCDHWIYSSTFMSSLFYKTIYKGKFFEKDKLSFKGLKIYYPEWVNDDTLWSFSSYGETSQDMFPNTETSTNSIENSKNILYYKDCVSNSINLSSNKYIKEVFELSEKLFIEIKELIPTDFKGNKLEKSEDYKKDIHKMIKFSNLKDLESIRSNIIKYFELLKNDNSEEGILNALINKLKDFKLDLIPGYENNLSNKEKISSLLDKYKYPVIQSDDVIILNIANYPDKKIWILKTIVNSQLVICNKEIIIKNKQISKIKKGELYINGFKQIEPEPEPTDSSYIIVNSEEEANNLAKELLVEIAQNTWPSKSIIIYDLELDNKNKKNNEKDKQFDFKILNWISDN
jgi:hypothetical protein